jgi:hypothetical protein
MRHKTPKVVEEYNAKVNAIVDINEPKCCHTCDYYMENGLCQQYQIEPPEDFASQLDQCQDWLPIIPF